MSMVVMAVNIYDTRLLKVIYGPYAHVVPAYTIQWVPLIVVGPIEDPAVAETLANRLSAVNRPGGLLQICEELGIAPHIQVRRELPITTHSRSAEGGDWNERDETRIGNIRFKKK